MSVGTDAIEISRIARVYKRHGERFLSRVYSDREIDRYRGRINELAARFADSHPGVPVLCISGYSDTVWAGPDGGCTYIQKPFSPAVLLTQVRTALDRSNLNPRRAA